MLSQTKLITAGGIDYTKDGKVVTTASVPQQVAGRPGSSTVINQVISTEGHTARQSRLKLDRKVSERLDASKNQVLVLGEDVAKKDIYPILDVFYRDPKSALNAKLVVSKGKASEVISTKYIKKQQSIGIGEHLKELIKSAEEGATVPIESIQTICPLMFDPGQDFALPYLEPQEKEVKVSGVALFHNHKMVGTLAEPLSVVYNMLTGEDAPISMSTTKKISSNHKERLLNYATIKVEQNQRNFNVKVSSSGRISASIKLKTKVVVTEYPLDNFGTPSEIKKLENELSKTLTKDAQEIIDRLQKMNSDPFGVGRQLMAFHNPTWKKLNWSEEYPKINFTSNVDVQIIGNGIIE